jgi:hypothetical protein
MFNHVGFIEIYIPRDGVLDVILAYVNRAAGSTRILIVEQGQPLPTGYLKKATRSGVEEGSKQ